MKATIDLSHKTVLISRTDSIGDVVLTLPLVGWIKERFPTSRVLFLGKSYTKDVLECSPNIDQIITLDEWEKVSFEEQIKLVKALNIFAFIHVFPNKHLAKLAKAAEIPHRVGTSHRLYHLFTCNVRPSFTRKKSNFHEAQLNFELMRKFGVQTLPNRNELMKYIGSFKPQVEVPVQLKEVLKEGKRVILHTKSQGSAVEWPIDKYIALANILVVKGHTVYFSGTEKEGELFRDALPTHPNIIDISGKSSLAEFIAFIESCDVLVACSTGPLHLASILGKKAIGLYTDLRPMHPGRWAPIGSMSKVLTATQAAEPSLSDIERISIESVFQVIDK
ncbi:glycosyltransferase family 9 protein [Brumimicrobium aurantiacum]|uniref:Lipopolysaccharide heptosyltransferase family protein n=1 Tax=Brumimicrobium aurantiacum TaxID=1737063 RepID=A0A3E1EXH3_9FLAO|nr:glycosyltransferase family 9 protein [Brumimicrobium aurantiacum]RFC54242.1 lipopolysaccharide heptosyltransferase family protein [Brumimicrobium aurantiacum]